MSFDTEKHKVLMKSGNQCAFPGCNNILSDACQIAHIRSKKSNGPRHEPNWNNGNFDVEENLICMCPTHHTLIDKNPNEFTTQILLNWKYEHENRIAQVMQEISSEDDKFLKNVFAILRKYELIECIAHTDPTIPTPTNKIENLDYCYTELEQLITNLWASEVSRELLNNWQEILNLIHEYNIYLIPYLQYNENGFFVNINPGESSKQILCYRNKIIDKLRKYLNPQAS